MPFIVVYDANPLVGNTQRDLLFQVALAGLVQEKLPGGSLTRPLPPSTRAGRILRRKSSRGCGN